MKSNSRPNPRCFSQISYLSPLSYALGLVVELRITALLWYDSHADALIKALWDIDLKVILLDYSHQGLGNLQVSNLMHTNVKNFVDY